MDYLINLTEFSTISYPKIMDIRIINTSFNVSKIPMQLLYVSIFMHFN